ncbi:MAG: hypothetical protein JW700_01005 [Candidatus Aenigmarchaeota archaeon]|nr:hypothetical protein [Candidatus Aenigmarchaeota archaeon]
MGDGVFTVWRRIPYGNFEEAPEAVKSLEKAMNGTEKYNFSVSQEKYWTVEKKGEDKGTIDFEEEFDPFGRKKEFSLRFLDLGEDRTLVQENEANTSFLDNYRENERRSVLYNRYYLIEKREIVKDPEKFKQVLKESLNIDIPSTKMKYDSYSIAHDLHVAKILTKPEEKIEIN